MMRFVLALALTVCVLTGCKKSAASTTAVVADSLFVSGVWTGCMTEPTISCEPVSMTLTDSVTSDSTETVAGTGNWGSIVTITGTLVDTRLTINGTATGVIEKFTFSGTLSGNTLSGNITVPDVATAYPSSFTRSP
jgi:hypothetical protein